MAFPAEQRWPAGSYGLTSTCERSLSCNQPLACSISLTEFKALLTQKQNMKLFDFQAIQYTHH